jgi:hypothetical protein
MEKKIRKKQERRKDVEAYKLKPSKIVRGKNTKIPIIWRS